MRRNGALEKHDLGNDRLREELIVRCCAPDGLFVMSKLIFGRDRLDERIHRPLAIWDREQLLIPGNLLSIRDPRGAGKSTMLVEDKVPWLVIQPPVPGTIFRGLNSRVAIMAPRFTLASIRLSGIQRQFEHPVFLEMAGDIVRPDLLMWSTTRGLRLMRGAASGGEPTVIPLGLDSIATQLHPPLVIIDDAVHEKNWLSMTELDRAKMCVTLAYNLTKSENGVREVIGNIWAIDDVQDSLRPRNPMYRNVKVWERGLISCEACVGGRSNPDAEDPGEKHLHKPGELAEPIIIQLLQPGSLAPMTEDEAAQVYADLPVEIASAQFDNAPVPPGATQLDFRDLKYWEWHMGGSGGTSDPALSIPSNAPLVAPGEALGARFQNAGARIGMREIIPLHELEIYILIDPAPTEETKSGVSQFAFVAIGAERQGQRMFLLEEYAKNKPPNVNYGAVLDCYLRWFPHVKLVDYESVGYQATIGAGLQSLANIRQITTFAGALGEGIPRMSSEGRQIDRIRYTLMPWFTSGVFYIHPSHRLFLGEVKRFGLKGAQHNLLDAASNLARVRGGRARRRKIMEFDPEREKRRRAGYGGFG